MDYQHLYDSARSLQPLAHSEALSLYRYAPLNELIALANELRYIHNPGKTLTWIADRNVNITNACFSRCSFCNFHVRPGDECEYITSMEEYAQKIEEMKRLGGNQLLLQGGMHPRLGLDFYTDLFRQLKARYPDVKLHALGPPEVAFLARKEKKSFRQVLEALRYAGLDSLPGAGAEILSDRVRKHLSPGKCSTGEWLDVMRQAHRMDMPTSATMMFGHIETDEEIIAHLMHIRQVQSEKPQHARGFLNFVPWPVQLKGTSLSEEEPGLKAVSADDYIRLMAISRVVLCNVQHIQPSWLTVGVETAQKCLHAGADDFGSIMIEENVVSSAGAGHRLNRQSIQEAIRQAGFEPRERNQLFEDVS